MSNQRAFLAALVGRRVRCRGIFERSGYVPLSVLIQDCEIAADDGYQYIGHVWVQHASMLKHGNPQQGDRLLFTAIVTSYADRTTGEQKNGLMLPEEVQPSLATCLRVPEPTIAPEPAPRLSSSVVPLDVILSVTQLITELGPERTKTTIADLADGSSERVSQLAKRVGSVDRLKELVDLLSPLAN